MITFEALTMMLERLWLIKDDPPHPQNFGIKDICLSSTMQPRRDVDDGEPLTAPGESITVNKSISY
jgi:hypothetical protein